MSSLLQLFQHGPITFSGPLMRTQALGSCAFVRKVLANRSTELQGAPASLHPKNTLHTGIFLCERRPQLERLRLHRNLGFSPTPRSVLRYSVRLFCSIAKQNHHPSLGSFKDTLCPRNGWGVYCLKQRRKWEQRSAKNATLSRFLINFSYSVLPVPSSGHG